MLPLVVLGVFMLLVAGTQGCCAPDYFSGVGVNMNKLVSFEFEVDFKRKKIMEKPTDANSAEEWRIVDFGNGVIYTKYRSGDCTKVAAPIKHAFDQCTPDNAVHPGLIKFMGPEGVLPVDSFNYKAQTGETVYVAVSKTTCYPMIHVIQNGDVVNRFFYADIHQRIEESDLDVDTSMCTEPAAANSG